MNFQWGPRLASGACALVAVVALAASVSSPSLADTKEAEHATMKACEASICTIAVKRAAGGGDIKCDLSKTWTKAAISQSVEKKKLTWKFGDARCTVPLVVPSQLLVDALTKPAEKMALPKHTAKCEVDSTTSGDKAAAVSVELAPSFEFKDGKAVKAKLNIGAIEAPTAVKGAIWTAATAEDYFGLFEGQIVAALNKLLLESCPKNHPAQ